MSITRTLVACCIVGFGLDFCNSQYAGMSETSIAKLQRAQNTLACVVTDHLHAPWPATREAMTSLWSWLTFTGCQSGPEWCSILHRWHTPCAGWGNQHISGHWFQMISWHMIVFTRPHCYEGLQRKAKEARTFSCVAVSIWNSSPPIISHYDSINTFRTRLKTLIHQTFS